MQSKGLNIMGLDATEISKKMEKFVADYFTGFTLERNQSMFSEGFMLYRPEVLGIIPVKHHPLFTDDDKFLGLSGYITVTSADGSTSERIVMLLMDEQHEYAYLLCVQEPDEGKRTSIVKDFLA